MNACPLMTTAAVRSVFSPRIGRSRAFRREWSDSILLFAARCVVLGAWEQFVNDAQEWGGERMNSDHDGPDLAGVGSRPASRKIAHTVDAAILCPRRCSSPCARR